MTLQKKFRIWLVKKNVKKLSMMTALRYQNNLLGGDFICTYMSKANSTSKSFFQIEEQVPVLLCQRTRLDDKSIFLQRGQVLLYFALTAK